MGGSALPSIGNISLIIEEGFCDPAFFTFSIPTVQGATSYQWTCNSNNPNFSGCYGGNSTTAYAEAFIEEGQTIYFSVTVTAMNGCGATVTKTQNFSYYAENCNHMPIIGGGGDGRSVKVIPNPVSTTQFTIEITDNLTELMEYQIVITNQFGEMKYLLETNEKINQVNVYNLPDGLYHVHVMTDESVTTANFIVQY
jgi:hypothetical protein